MRENIVEENEPRRDAGVVVVGSKTNKGSRVMFQSEPLCPPDVPADVSGRVSLRADKLNS